MPYCPICGITFKDRRGLHGHFRFKHKVEYGTGQPAKETALTKAIERNIERRISGDEIMKVLDEQRLEKEREVIFLDMKREKGDDENEYRGVEFVWSVKRRD